MARDEFPQTETRLPSRGIFIVLILVAIILGARSIAQLVIEFEWWKELGQIATWQNIIIYSFAPLALATVLAFAVLWIVHARALKFAGTGMGEHRTYARISTLVLAVLAFVIARASLDSWTIVSFYGSQRAGTLPNAWHDPIFNHTLSFYLFELPFYSQLLGLLLGITVVGTILFWGAARAWQLMRQVPGLRSDAQISLQPSDLLLAADSNRPCCGVLWRQC
jgi:uncharacterized membrane protein (UPF0182 family)